VTELEQLKVWGALAQLSHLGDGAARLTRQDVGAHFDSVLDGLRIADGNGLTRIKEIAQDDDGFETAVIFEQVRTETGKIFVTSPAPSYKPTRSEERQLEMQLTRDAARIRARDEG
jgi:hypothetical protein